MPTALAPTSDALRRAVIVVAILNLAYFFVESGAALIIGSVSLLADSIDFLEDAAVNGLIAVAIGWTAASRARVGKLLAAVIFIPALATLWIAWEKFNAPLPPEPVTLTLAGLGALAVNLFCAFLLAKHRHHGGGLAKAAFLSARNDAIANIAIIAAGLVTAFLWRSGWPDLIVGLGIAWLNANAAREVWRAASDEGTAAP